VSKILITGVLGLVGSESARYYLKQGHDVLGIDNDMRKYFFGNAGSGMGNMIEHPNYSHRFMDINDSGVLISRTKPDVIIHAAAQPSHDWAAQNPVLDFKINAMGTIILLDAFKRHVPGAVFVYLSTNKVYGDRPNNVPLRECSTRYDSELEGINESMAVDRCLHSLFGVSKLAGDLMVQEYGRYFGLKTGVFRCGCITGSQHAGVEQHGFLSYMVRCKKEKIVYKIYGYKGKQVRDNIHAYDLVRAIDCFINTPHRGEVYNMGGSRHSNISVLEALEKFKIKDYEYIDEPRKGDHQWYISDVSKFKSHYPEWDYTYDMEAILEDLISAQPV